MGWSERQQCLKEQYFFDCQCTPCVAGEADEALYLVCDRKDLCNIEIKMKFVTNCKKKHLLIILLFIYIVHSIGWVLGGC